MSPSTDPVVITRPGRASDLAFVYSTWLAELRSSDQSPLPNDIFYPAHREYINRVLADPAVQLVIAAPTDRPDDILGYIVAEEGFIQWLHLKPQFRGKHLGLVQLLLNATDSQAAHLAWKTGHSKKMRNAMRSRQARLLHSQGTVSSSTASQ